MKEEREPRCHHCGPMAGLEHKENVIYKSVREYIPDRGSITWHEAIAVEVCPRCSEPTVSWFLDSEDTGIIDDRRLYPAPRDNSAIPARVRPRLAAANRVKSIEPGLYAVAIRRMLETVCNEEGANGRDLFAKLDDLATRDRMPTTLAAAAHEIRKLGNFGAHDDQVEITADDVPAIEDLADAILEYLYRAPAKLAVVQASIAERMKTAEDDQDGAADE